MDFEKARRRQSLKVIISEAIMLLAVIAMVVILAFIVSGYWVGSDFEVRRQGLLQISSVPTGADVDIDGESFWLQRTNTSKVLASGEHTVTLTKEGYDSWQKTINIPAGMLYRVHYPRLFLQNRSIEKLLPTTGVTSATISPNHEYLLMMNETTEWTLTKLTDERLSPQKINISGIFSTVSLASDAKIGLFTGAISSLDWSQDGSRILFANQTPTGIEWIILNLENIPASINLTKEFGANFAQVKIHDRSANTLLATQNNNLHKIDASGRSISAVLVENVLDYDFYHNEIIFTASGAEPDFYIGKTRLGDAKITKLKNLSSPALVKIMKFYEDKYIIVNSGSEITLHSAEDFAEISTFSIDFEPKSIKIGHNGEFVIMRSGPTVATLDMEPMTITEWSVEGEDYGWLDNDMIYTVHGGGLIVYDFDGQNRRVIAKNVSSHFPVSITGDRYLYYFSDDSLMREWLIPH